MKFRPPRDFFRALAYMRFFSNVKTLNIRFNEWCGLDERNNQLTEETYDFRYLVLDIIFRCLAGHWPEAHRPLREESLVPFSPGDRGTLPPLPTEGILNLDGEEPEAIDIQTITISNLADFDDKRLTDSRAFRQVLSSKALTSIKLYVAIETSGRSPEALFYAEKYDFCESLPYTWLSPPVAQNLKVLSLSFQDYWGWNPKMDFRAVNPGKGALSGLPNLRVLALGNYVFSHDWQIDWISSSIGHDNGRGGLEELYLDDCPIIWQARTLQPLDESKVTHVLSDGDVIQYSNDGYPLKAVMTQGSSNRDPAVLTFSLRWSEVLHRWRENMKALKVFKMAHGSWEEDVLDVNQDPTLLDDAYQRQRQRLKDTNHLNYNCPSPPVEGGFRSMFGGHSTSGLGLARRREHILQYIHFDVRLGPTPWIERDFIRKMIQDESLESYNLDRQKDEEAYKQLVDVVSRRAQE
jgi:hypothetical protein